MHLRYSVERRQNLQRYRNKSEAGLTELYSHANLLYIGLAKPRGREVAAEVASAIQSRHPRVPCALPRTVFKSGRMDQDRHTTVYWSLSHLMHVAILAWFASRSQYVG
jgi:hypothetical protein